MVQELNSSLLKGFLHPSNSRQSACERVGARRFHRADRVHVHLSLVRQGLLIHVRERARRLQLIACDEHQRCVLVAITRIVLTITILIHILLVLITSSVSTPETALVKEFFALRNPG